jgi:hypothetical protein
MEAVYFFVLLTPYQTQGVSAMMTTTKNKRNILVESVHGMIKVWEGKKK